MICIEAIKLHRRSFGRKQFSTFRNIFDLFSVLGPILRIIYLLFSGQWTYLPDYLLLLTTHL